MNERTYKKWLKKGMTQNDTPGFFLEVHSSMSVQEDHHCLLEGGQPNPGEDSSVLTEVVGDRHQAEGGGSQAEPLLWTLPWELRCRLLCAPQGTGMVLEVLPAVSGPGVESGVSLPPWAVAVWA